MRSVRQVPARDRRVELAKIGRARMSGMTGPTAPDTAIFMSVLLDYQSNADVDSDKAAW